MSIYTFKRNIRLNNNLHMKFLVLLLRAFMFAKLGHLSKAINDRHQHGTDLVVFVYEVKRVGHVVIAQVDHTGPHPLPTGNGVWRVGYGPLGVTQDRAHCLRNTWRGLHALHAL
jgi:hypothetical protein